MVQQNKRKGVFMEEKKVNLPKKGAARRLAERLKKLGQQKPPKPLMDKINQDDNKQVANSKVSTKDLEI